MTGTRFSFNGVKLHWITLNKICILFRWLGLTRKPTLSAFYISAMNHFISNCQCLKLFLSKNSSKALHIAIHFFTGRSLFTSDRQEDMSFRTHVHGFATVVWTQF